MLPHDTLKWQKKWKYFSDMRVTCIEIKLNILPTEKFTCMNICHMLFIARFPVSLPVYLTWNSCSNFQLCQSKLQVIYKMSRTETTLKKPSFLLEVMEYNPNQTVSFEVLWLFKKKKNHHILDLCFWVNWLNGFLVLRLFKLELILPEDRQLIEKEQLIFHDLNICAIKKCQKNLSFSKSKYLCISQLTHSLQQIWNY